MSEELSTLMIQRILANVGAVPNSPGVSGLMDKNLLLTRTIKVKYDNGNADHNMYVGAISLGKNKIKGLLIDLSIDDSPEFMFVFRMDELPIHVAKVTYDKWDIGETYLRIYNSEKKNWMEASIYFKARLLADFERLASHGYLWEDYEDYEDLYEAAVETLNLQKG